jgi:Helix-turn-helix domain
MNANVKTKHALQPPLAPLDPNQRYTMPESSRYLRLSRPEIYKQIAAGQLKTVTDGRRRYVPGHEIIRKTNESRSL